MSTQQPNIRLVLPNPNDATDPANLQAIVLWAVNYVVNQIVAGLGITLKTQSQAVGSGAAGTGIVTIENDGLLGLVAGTNITITEVSTGVYEIAASGSGGTFYASLTGPGETTSPGALTQDGNLTVDGAVDINDPDGTFIVAIHGGNNINIAGPLMTLADSQIEMFAGNFSLEVAGGPVSIIGATGLGGVADISIGLVSDEIGFFGTTPVVQPTVTGSRGGNAALASLLTALADLGLIVNSSTP